MIASTKFVATKMIVSSVDVSNMSQDFMKENHEWFISSWWHGQSSLDLKRRQNNKVWKSITMHIINTWNFEIQNNYLGG